MMKLPLENASRAWHLVWVPLVLSLFMLSCKKDSFISSPDALLLTSVDSLKFDTVFTSVGAVTHSLKISNPNSQRLLINSLKLAGGSTSAFTININGNPVSAVNDIAIDAGDSIYVFVTVNINPNTANLPFIVRDSVQITYNGNNRYVQLEAFGQNANFLRNRVIRGNITWTNQLPYVILGSLQVDTGATLTIEAGCRIYAHADAPLIIDGSLVTNGTFAQKVVFTGDRLEEDYRDLPAGWPGIYFRSSSNSNVLTHTIVKNAYQAIVAESSPGNTQPKVTLHQCIIDNAYDAGILCVNSSLAADNCLISNSGKNIQLIYGGNYRFTNCTTVGYSSYLTHRNSSLTVSNFVTRNGITLTADVFASFTNCIFWGEKGLVDDEINVAKQGTTQYNVVFDRCLYKMKNNLANATVTAPLINQDPLFDSINVSRRYFDFHISKNTQAPGIDKGSPGGFLKDLDDNNRNVGPPDLGCYERQ